MANKQDFGNSLDLVDIKEIRDKTVVIKNGGLHQVIMVGGVNFSLKSDEEQALMTQAYQDFLNGVDFPLQIVVHSRKVNIEKYVSELLSRKTSEDSPLIRNQIDEYASFVSGFVEQNAIMEKSFLVVVPFYPTSLLPVKKPSKGIFSSLFGKKADAGKGGSARNTKNSEGGGQAGEPERNPEEERAFRENLAQLSQRASQTMSGLLNIGLEASVLDDSALTELYYNFYNPQTVEKKIAAPASGATSS